MIASPSIKYIFSGHDTFQCRQFWLKKGFDFLENEGEFSNERAVVDLGVGKNMVTSIRYWLKAFGIVDNAESITPIGRLLFQNNGWDPYLEDDASLWLLHHQLVSKNIASTYFLIFIEFRREKIEFTKQQYVDFIERKSRTERGINFNPRTIGGDFEVFRKLYLNSKEEKSIEDSFAGLLSDLGLLGTIFKGRDEDQLNEANAKERIEAYYITNTHRPSLPVEVLLYSIVSNPAYGQSVSLESLATDINGPGAIFGLSKAGIFDKLEEGIDRGFPITYSNYAGVNELQFKETSDPIQILDDYYAR
jgi:hypothetical protein